jgi:hypothetical protein
MRVRERDVQTRVKGNRLIVSNTDEKLVVEVHNVTTRSRNTTVTVFIVDSRAGSSSTASDESDSIQSKSFSMNDSGVGLWVKVTTFLPSEIYIGKLQ